MLCVVANYINILILGHTTSLAQVLNLPALSNLLLKVSISTPIHFHWHACHVMSSVWCTLLNVTAMLHMLVNKQLQLSLKPQCGSLSTLHNYMILW